MNRLFLDLTAIFAITFVVAAVVSYLYSLAAHGKGVVDWGTAFSMAIVLSIVLTWMDRQRLHK